VIVIEDPALFNRGLIIEKKIFKIERNPAMEKLYEKNLDEIKSNEKCFDVDDNIDDEQKNEEKNEKETKQNQKEQKNNSESEMEHSISYCLRLKLPAGEKFSRNPNIVQGKKESKTKIVLQ
jgi:hypothetical protein